MRDLARLCRGLLLALACLLPACATAAGVPALTIHGNKTTFEIAPVLLAAERLYGGDAVKMGGVPNLFGLSGPSGFSEPGVADLATNAETQALRISAANPGLRIIMTVSEGLYRLVGRRSAGIATVADLKDKRIATIPGTSSGYFLHKLLKTAGLTLGDVTVVPILPLADMPKQLAEKKVDAATIWEPEMENASVALGADAIEFSGEGIYRELFNLNTTAAVLADPAKRARVVAFVRAAIQASADINKDPSVAWPLVEKAGGYSRPVIARAWPHHSFPARLEPDLLDVMVEQEQFLAANDKRPARTRAELATLIDASILEEAKR